MQQSASHLEAGHTREPSPHFPYTEIPELYPTRLTVTNSEIAILGIITQTQHGDLHILHFSGCKYNNKLNNQTKQTTKKPLIFHSWVRICKTHVDSVDLGRAYYEKLIKIKFMLRCTLVNLQNLSHVSGTAVEYQQNN